MTVPRPHRLRGPRRRTKQTVDLDLLAELPNPYDYRMPVTDREKLVGRKELLTDIERLLGGAANGRPTHIAFVGARAAGKTSLLNITELIAVDLDLLPVWLMLDEGVVADTVTFFGALFDAAVEALVDAGALEETDTRYVGWQGQVLEGRQGLEPDQGLLRFGSIAAARINGKPTTDVSPAVLVRDFERIAAIAEEVGIAGVVLLLDEGDLLGQSPVVIQRLRNILQSISSWTLIAAGTEAMFGELTEVFSPIPRQFTRMNVENFRSPRSVFDCVQRPVEAMGASFIELLPDIGDVMEIASITGGSPYEINLICYHMWEVMVATRESELELTPRVLDGVLEELSIMGRDEPHDLAVRIRRLSLDDLICCAEIAPYETMSGEEIAQARLLPSLYTEDELQAEMSKVAGLVSHVSSLGLAEIDRSTQRFSIPHDAYVRTYLRYACKLRLDRPIQYQQRLGDQVLRYLTEAAERELLDPLGYTPYSRLVIHKELGDPMAGRTISEITNAVQTNEGHAELSPRSSRILMPDRLDYQDGELVIDAARRGLVFIGLGVTFGTDVEEWCELQVNPADSDDEINLPKIESWIDTQTRLLEHYGGRVDRVEIHQLDSSQASRLLGQRIISDSTEHLVLDAILKRKPEMAKAHVERYLQLLKEQPGLQPESSDRKGFWENVYGFSLLACGSYEAAADQFEKAIDHGFDDVWLSFHNLAYCRLTEGDFESAGQLIDSSLEVVDPDELNGAHLFGLFPPSSQVERKRPRDDFVSLDADETIAFLQLERVIMQYLAQESSKSELSDAISDSNEWGNHLGRLAFWTYATVLDQPDSALECLERSSARLELGLFTTPESVLAEKLKAKGDPQ